MRLSLPFVALTLCADLSQSHAEPGDNAALLQVSGATEPMTELSSNHGQDLPLRNRRKDPRVPFWHEAILHHIEDAKSAAKQMELANKSGNSQNPIATFQQIQASKKGMRLIYQAVRGYNEAQVTMVNQMVQIYPFKAASAADAERDLDLRDDYHCLNMSTATRSDFDDYVYRLEAVYMNYRSGWDNVYDALFRSADIITDYYEHRDGRILHDELTQMIRGVYNRTRLREELEVKHNYLNCILDNLTSVEFTPRTHTMREFSRLAWNCTMYLNYTVFTLTTDFLSHQAELVAGVTRDDNANGLRMLFGFEYYDQLVAVISFLGETAQRSQNFGDVQAELLCDKPTRMDRVRRELYDLEVARCKARDAMIEAEMEARGITTTSLHP